MEISGGGAALAGALDSKTYDFDLEQRAKTQNAARDMSLATEQLAAPATLRFEANMSGIQEESELNVTAFPKTVNAAMPMEIDEDEVEDVDENDGGEQLAEIDHKQDGRDNAKTVNFAADMELATATTNFNARTTNFNVPMEVDEESSSSGNENEAEQAGDALNQGFTKDWAAANTGAKTVNFAAPMELVEEEEENQTNMSSSNESADNNFPAQWNLSYAGGSHLAAADAVRKSLEQGAKKPCLLFVFFWRVLRESDQAS